MLLPPVPAAGTRMQKALRPKLLVVCFVSLVIGIVWLLSSGSGPQAEKPTAGNYYHGVFRNKKDPNMWGDENGNPAPPPADAIPYDANRSIRDTSRETMSVPIAGARRANIDSSSAGGKGN
jgi:hypothetical protein